MTVGRSKIKLLPPSFSPWSPGKGSSRQIAALMSGGVDSSITAHLLKQAGWDVLGITMKIPQLCQTGTRGCCGADAALVCNELGIEHYFLDVSGAFEELIIQPFRLSYASGRTPNPCADCNSFLKFSLVSDFLQERFGIYHLATGHYAYITGTDGQTRLARAKDKSKDQSYFLYGIAREKLDKLVFPLGNFTKQQVRSIAGRLNLSVADKQESMELCFAGEADYRAALAEAGGNRSGDLEDMQGGKIGTHKGIANYTIGQRRGLGFAGGKPLYVGKIDAQRNVVSLGTREEVSCCTVSANEISELIPEQLISSRRLFGKIRSYGEPRPCKVVSVEETNVKVQFDEAQFAPCPGQKLVLYNSEEQVVAGGTIIPSCD